MLRSARVIVSEERRADELTPMCRHRARHGTTTKWSSPLAMMMGWMGSGMTTWTDSRKPSRRSTGKRRRDRRDTHPTPQRSIKRLGRGFASQALSSILCRSLVRWRYLPIFLVVHRRRRMSSRGLPLSKAHRARELNSAAAKYVSSEGPVAMEDASPTHEGPRRRRRRRVATSYVNAMS